MFSMRCVKLLAGVLCSSMVISIAPLSRLFDKVNADTVINYAGEKPSTECSYRSVEEASYTAEVKTINKWSGHSNVEITFKNTGTETIHDWYFTFDFNYKIENPYNCRVIENKDNLYTIDNNDWNQDIQPGKTVTIGFTAASKDGSDIKDMPMFYLLNTETVMLKSGDLKYKYEEYSNWSSGFNGALILTNKTKETIRDWTITFSANRPITQADSSVFTDNSDGTYTITNDGNNQNIAKGQSYRIGIQGGANNPSKAFELTDFTATAKKMALKLTDDKDKNGIADVLEVDFNGTVTVTPTEPPTSTPTATNTPSVTSSPTATNTPTVTPSATSKPTATVTSTPKPTVTATSTPTVTPSATTKPTATNTPTSTNKPTSTPTATITPTKKPTISATPTAKPTVTSTPTVTSSPTATPKPTISATPAPTISSAPTPTPVVTVTPTNTITVTPTPTAMPTGIPDDIDYYTDTDGDGLPDDLEDYYGTDKNKKDTDRDGVNDLYELILETDPLTPDSNGSNDFDNDGLTNARESELGTNPKSRDTDLDNLTDGEEVNLYGTDPKKYDTDDDGMSDYFEVYTYDCNPKAKDSEKKRYQTMDFYPLINNKLDGVVRVEISGAITGAMSENTKIRDVYGKDLHTSSIEALVGVPVDIETTGEFDEMTVRFYYEEGDFDEDDLMIMWYDEEHGEYVEWEDTVWQNYEENYVEFNTKHFSKYMLIDEKVWINTWINAIYSVKDIELNNVGGGGIFPLNSINSYKNSMLERYGDNDHDGIPDIMETNGMINNIGHVVYTDSNKTDSDTDGLNDGIEMGEMSTMQKIFTRSYYYFNKMPYKPVSGDATYEGYVYFKSKSEAENDDSDGDGAKDGVDKTKGDKNPAVNYILYYEDPAITGIRGNKEEYCWRFALLGMEYECFEINSAEEYEAFWKHMCYECTDHHNVKDTSFTKLEKYSGVRNLIIDFHGADSEDQWTFIDTPEGEHDGIDELSIALLAMYNTKFKIDNVDIQSCYAFLDRNNNGKSIGLCMVIADNISRVFGTNAPLSYNFMLQTNQVAPGYNISSLEYSKDTGIKVTDYGWIQPLLFWELL